MDIKKLSDKEKKEFEDFSKYYENCYMCRKCNVVFGSDLSIEDAICPSCKKEKEKDD